MALQFYTCLPCYIYYIIRIIVSNALYNYFLISTRNQFFFQNSKTAHAIIAVNVIDENDNAPVFLRTRYEGHISEAAEIGSVVLTPNNEPLVVQAEDADSGTNSNLVYKIREEEARMYFNIASSTGNV